MKCATVVFAAILATACGSPARPTTPVDARVTVPLGQTATIPSAGVSVRFDSVVEDSRCPADANCVWQGRAVVKLTVIAASRPVGIELGSDPEPARAVAVNGLRLEWMQLDPYPFASRPTQPGDYRLTINVVR